MSQKELAILWTKTKSICEYFWFPKKKTRWAITSRCMMTYTARMFTIFSTLIV